MLGMSVRRAQREIDSREFSEWLAYRRIRHDPEDIRTARLCCVVARLAGNKRAKIDDFLPRLKPLMQSGAEIKARFQAFAAATKARKAMLAERAKKRAERKANRGDKDRRRNRG